MIEERPLFERLAVIKEDMVPISSFHQAIGNIALPTLKSLKNLKIQMPNSSEYPLDELVKAGDASPWRWLVDKILRNTLDRAFGHAVYFDEQNVSDRDIKVAYKKAFINPKIFKPQSEDKSHVDYAYASTVGKYPRIIHGFKEIKEITKSDKFSDKYAKSPIILRLNKQESIDIVSDKSKVQHIKDLFKQAPFIILLLEGSNDEKPAHSYIISSHFPQDGVVAGSLLQTFTKKLYGKVIDVKDVSDEAITDQLKLSDNIETHGNTISESTIISGDEFAKLSKDYENIQAQHENITIPKSVYIWLKILETLGVDGQSLTAVNLRFNPKISEQLNLFNIENVKTILQKLKSNDYKWLEEHGMLHKKNDGSDGYLFGFARNNDITKEVVGRLLQSLPTSLYDKVWDISKILGVLEALVPKIHISTIPVSITVGDSTLEIGGICTTALSDYEQLGMVMMIHEKRLILRWKRYKVKK